MKIKIEVEVFNNEDNTGEPNVKTLTMDWNLENLIYDLMKMNDDPDWILNEVQGISESTCVSMIHREIESVYDYLKLKQEKQNGKIS